MGLRDYPIENGVQEFEMDSWQDFVKSLMEGMKLETQFIWRGQNQSYPLLPSIERHFNEMTDAYSRLEIREKHLENFKYTLRGKLGQNPPDFKDRKQDREIWALGQHYGLDTPLLDWTESPFVAAFFAHEKENNEQKVVFALNKKIITQLPPSRYESNKFLEPHKLKPNYDPSIVIFKPESHFNPNLISQQGLFTIFNFVNLDMESWIREVFKDEINSPILLKFIFPIRNREPFLIFLNRMNINHQTLFPDLSGASKYCNFHLTIPKY